MRGDALVLIKDFQQRPGGANINALAHIRIRTRRVMAIKAYIVIKLHRGLFPVNIFIGYHRQRLQERCCIELFQKLSNGVVHLGHAEEFLIAELGDDVAGYIAHIALDSCLVFGRKHPGWQDCGVVMVSELLVCLVCDLVLALTVEYNPRFQVVRDK